VDDFAHLRSDPGLAELIGHEMPSPEVARKFLNAFHVAAKLVVVLADERSARETCPVVPVAIPGGGANDQAVESPGVKVLVGMVKPCQLRQEGEQVDRS
jgi:hypothetical protein